MLQDKTLQEQVLAAVARDDDLRRQLLEALLTPADGLKMTYEEFLAWADRHAGRMGGC